jgi:antitoxin ParD1/3/4
MNISLTPELEKIVQDKVNSGLYGNASEVLRAGLRLLVEQEQLRQSHFEQLVQDIQIGLEQAERGEIVSGPQAFEKLEKRHKSRKK